MVSRVDRRPVQHRPLKFDDDGIKKTVFLTVAKKKYEIFR